MERNGEKMTIAEQLSCLTDRPCDVCKFHTENGCDRWECVFEEEPDDCEYYEKERGDMTREEAIKELQESHDIMRSYDIDESESRLMTALDMAIKTLEQEPCEDWYDLPADEMTFKQARQAVKDLRIMLAEYLTQEPKTGHCKDCKYFEYDSVAKVDGIPLIIAHEICNRWGDGCKTKEDGYCFLFEPKESEDKE